MAFGRAWKHDRFSSHHWILLLACCLGTWGTPPANAQRDRDKVNPVRVGDEVEAKWINTWYRGKILDYNDGFANVEYKWGSSLKVREFSVDEMRFPNGEGHWRMWSDASGKFKIEARFISRTATDVTIRKPDGTDISVPINQLAGPLRRQLA
ncbi:MAG: SHD1 domain-containing protein, partial [Rubripirellula sp.]